MMKFKGIIFDMDGTLTVPIIDFNRIRHELEIPDGEDIVRAVNRRPESERLRAWHLIEHYEDELAEQNRIQPGVAEAFCRFNEKGIKLAILTRNSSRNVERFLHKFKLSIDLYLSREYEYIKPSPEPVRHILDRWQLCPEDCLVVGDYIHDLECGNAAGCPTCFFHNDGKDSYADYADYSVRTYRELEGIVLS